MIFIDSNIPMYLIGNDHPHKLDAQRLLERIISDRIRLVTDAEVFQEILHRYVSIKRLDAIAPAFELLKNICDEILSISETSVMRARNIVLSYPQLSSRDAIHISTMELRGVHRILTFDKGFDHFPNVSRVVTKK